MIYFSKLKITIVLLVSLLGIVFAAPNMLDRSVADSIPDWLPKKQVSLGLDLQGGSHLLLEVGIDAVLAERVESLQDAIRARFRIENPRILNNQKAIKTDVVVTVNKPEEIQRAADLLRGIDPNFTMEIEGNQIRFAFAEDALNQERESIMQTSMQIISVRIDELGTKEPTIQRQGTDRILVQVPGVDDPERLKEILGKTAKMTFHLVPEDQSSAFGRGRVPAGTKLLPFKDGAGRDGAVPNILVRKRIELGGDSLVDSQPTIDQQSGQPVVSFRFDSRGAKKFGDITRKNVNRRFAIVLDNEVISAPNIREPILGGSGIITGGFTVQSAGDLALLLRAGALPAPLTILEERTVGPGLGADSVTAGKFASIIGLIAVIVFMVIIYGLFGIFAVIALVVNMLLILGGLSLLQATLTLPGIAGIVLTIGMAVDANVLIFERIREEVRAGRTPISAIDAGYSRAISTIIDANLTTLIAALILFFFGTGPIRGFAVTLSIGILTSMFTAILLTRLMVVTWLRKRSPTVLPV
ncbi:MAG: protein translocase subunit SecD [Proteobacteria bacterium]|nr:protein translocase subunit SecD [Pseudomonadota bacterium]